MSYKHTRFTGVSVFKNHNQSKSTSLKSGYSDSWSSSRILRSDTTYTNISWSIPIVTIKQSRRHLSSKIWCIVSLRKISQSPSYETFVKTLSFHWFNELIKKLVQTTEIFFVKSEKQENLMVFIDLAEFCAEFFFFFW